jgi:SNF2 family DNA or RNA helicase
MARVADQEGGSTASLGKLNNVLMQVRVVGQDGRTVLKVMGGVRTFERSSSPRSTSNPTPNTTRTLQPLQMRKNCNHPDLITGPFSASTMYPSPEVLVEQCGKLALLQRLLDRLKAGGHKVLIFSQVRGARARRVK